MVAVDHMTAGIKSAWGHGAHLGGDTELWGFPRWLSGKEFTCQCRRCGLDPWVGKITWRRKWQPTPILLPRKSHGQRSLVGYSPQGQKELDVTEGRHT